MAVDEHTHVTVEQLRYFETEHVGTVAAYGVPTLYNDINLPDHNQTYPEWRGVIHDDMARDNVAFFNNRELNPDQEWYVFDYTECHTLYEVSELLERWCKTVTAKIRNQGTWTPTAAHGGEPAGLRLDDPHPDRPRLYNRNGEELDNIGYATFLLRIFIGPDYTMRVICSAPDYLGCFFNKGFRNVFKLPRFLDYDLTYRFFNSPNNYEHSVLPKLSSPFVFNPASNAAQNEEIVANLAVPFVPRLSFQDTYHRVQGFTLTSDLPSVGELSISNAYYRILSDFKYTPSTGTIESSASKNNFLQTDTNFISEAPPGNVEYFAANGTTGRLILLRGAYPLYRMVLQVMADVIVQNPYERLEGGYIKFRKDIHHVMPSRE